MAVPGPPDSLRGCGSRGWTVGYRKHAKGALAPGVLPSRERDTLPRAQAADDLSAGI
jgi:hypothetical protein